jgi:predicted alpha-1,2-mannosidase
MRTSTTRAMRWCAALALAGGVATASPQPAFAASPDLTGLVSPFAGTRETPRDLHSGKVYPGATMPFGMLQWSPDLVPRGYAYRTAAEGTGRIKGFSLTHISGAGCAIYQDFPFTPTTARLHGSPAARGGQLQNSFTSAFTHARERASPGLYRVLLNPGQRDAIGVRLTATTRTGFARLTYPHGGTPRMLINAGGSAKRNQFAKVRIRPGRREVSGVATSGHFCGQRPLYRVYFDAKFNRPFQSHGTWEGNRLRRGGTVSRDRGDLESPRKSARAGAYLTFASGRRHTVGVRAAISFVSTANARRNLRAESAGRGFASIRRHAAQTWERMLGRVRVHGGSRAARQTFYTNLYHLLVAPRTFSDANGQYIGMDDRVHDAHQRVQYADFSGWDVYRSDFALLAMLLPSRTSDIVSSLLADARQSGCLPKWSLANGQTMEMLGDPAAPAIASAAAFGARGFDTADALQAMLAGATQACRSRSPAYVERQGLGPYLSLGYVPYELNVQGGGATGIDGSPDAVYGSGATTLEYLTADFAIAQFAARELGDGSTYATFMDRAAKWVSSFDPGAGYIKPRRADGSFPAIPPISTEGFAEGDSAQYTWMVPYDLAGLAGAMGGMGTAAQRLDHFLTKLNDVRLRSHSPYAVLGNEPSLGAPWIYDWLGQPFKAQATVRGAIRTLYSARPGGYPGNDDLGQLSSWYLFGALGLYPEVPGVGLLAVGSPLFPRASLRLHGGRLVISGHNASPEHPYVQDLRLNGQPYTRPWIPYCELAGGARLDYRLGSQPNPGWGSDPGVAPPSFDASTPFPSSPCAF